MSAVVLEPRTIPTGTWSADLSHSAIEFHVTNFMPGTIRGRFTDFDGTLEVDGEGPRAHAVIRAASLHTHEEKRDGHLRSPDFLNTERFPEISFESTAVEHIEGDRFRFTGTLTIQETPLELELEATVRGPADDPYGNERLHVDGGTSIEWGPQAVDLVVDVSLTRNA